MSDQIWVKKVKQIIIWKERSTDARFVYNLQMQGWPKSSHALGVLHVVNSIFQLFIRRWNWEAVIWSLQIHSWAHRINAPSSRRKSQPVDFAPSVPTLVSSLFAIDSSIYVVAWSPKLTDDEKS